VLASKVSRSRGASGRIKTKPYIAGKRKRGERELRRFARYNLKTSQTRTSGDAKSQDGIGGAGGRSTWKVGRERGTTPPAQHGVHGEKKKHGKKG